MTLAGKRALITGGSKGLGLEAARVLVQQGVRVAILARNSDHLKQAADELRAQSSADVLHVCCDVSVATKVEEAFKYVQFEWGGIDILVNNAGGSSRGFIENITDEQWQADFDVKLFSAIRMSRLVVPGMIAQRWGRIINVLNTLAKTPEAGSAPTSVTRAAGVAFTKVLANELAPHNVLVNALCIGRIESEQWKSFHARDSAHLPYETYLREQGSKIPLGRLGRPEEFAGLVAFLCSDSGGYITGTAINIDGGLSPAV